MIRSGVPSCRTIEIVERPVNGATTMSRTNFVGHRAKYVDFMAAPVAEPELIHHLITQGARAASQPVDHSYR